MTLDFPAAEAARGSWGGWPEGGLRQIRYRNKICHRQLDQQRHRCVCVARLFLWIHQHLSIWIRTPPKGGLNLDRPHRGPPPPPLNFPQLHPSGWPVLLMFWLIVLRAHSHPFPSKVSSIRSWQQWQPAKGKQPSSLTGHSACFVVKNQFFQSPHILRSHRVLLVL